MTFDNGAELYAIYLFAKNGCFPHKLDWDSLLEKIKRESGMNDADIIEGTDMYEECKKKGGCYGDLLNSLPSYYNSYVYWDGRIRNEQLTDRCFFWKNLHTRLIFFPVSEFPYTNPIRATSAWSAILTSVCIMQTK